nr:MAG TPA: Protein of unknown function (DUF3645) [Caudoviricetes sp.]
MSPQGQDYIIILLFTRVGCLALPLHLKSTPSRDSRWGEIHIVYTT